MRNIPDELLNRTVALLQKYDEVQRNLYDRPDCGGVPVKMQRELDAVTVALQSLPELPAVEIPAPVEAETCEVDLVWQCCNVTGDGLYQYLCTACDGNASDRDEWKFCPICGKPITIKSGRE